MSSFYDMEILCTFLLIFIYTMSGVMIEHYKVFISLINYLL
jgi:hypothetical protein